MAPLVKAASQKNAFTPVAGRLARPVTAKISPVKRVAEYVPIPIMLKFVAEPKSAIIHASTPAMFVD